MLIVERIQEDRGLSSGQQAAVRFLVTHGAEVADLSAREIARRVHTSPAALVRLAKRFGYDGFTAFKRDFLAEHRYLQAAGTVDANLPFGPHDDAGRIAQRLTHLAQETVEDIGNLVDPADLQRAAALLARADTVHVAAVSFPAVYARAFQLQMARIGRRVEVADLAGEQLFAQELVRPGDCALAISYSGETPATVGACRAFKARGAAVVALTSLGSNSLRDLADAALTLSSRERLYTKVGGFSSELSMKLVLDMLYACVFANDYEGNLRRKVLLSRRSEPGRFSSSAPLREKP